jgi:hypothetical protein
MTLITIKKKVPAVANITTAPFNDTDTLTTIADRIKDRNGQYAIETGKDLLAAKAIVEHGSFGAWLQENFGWSISTAQNYMNATKLAAENATVGKMKPAAIIALAAPNVPETVKAEVLADLDTGKIPTPKEVKAKIADAKAASASNAHVGKAKAETAEQPPDDSKLIAHLQAVGLDRAIAAFNAAFPTADLSLDPDVQATEVA